MHNPIDMGYLQYTTDYVTTTKERDIKAWFLATPPFADAKYYWTMIYGFIDCGFLHPIGDTVYEYFNTKDESVFDPEMRKFLMK